MTPRYTLAFSCPDRPGIVFRTSGAERAMPAKAERRPGSFQFENNA